MSGGSTPKDLFLRQTVNSFCQGMDILFWPGYTPALEGPGDLPEDSPDNLFLRELPANPFLQVTDKSQDHLGGLALASLPPLEGPQG